MNHKEEIKNRIEIMQAYVGGNEIKVRLGWNWKNIKEVNSDCQFNFFDNDYRIKPEDQEPGPVDVVGKKVIHEATKDIILITIYDNSRKKYKIEQELYTYKELKEYFDFIE